MIRETHDVKAMENDVKVSLDSLKEEDKETNNEEKKPDVDRDVLKKGNLHFLTKIFRSIHVTFLNDLSSRQMFFRTF